MAHSTNDFFAAIDPVVNRSYYGLDDENRPEPQYSTIFKVSSDSEPQMSAVEYAGPATLSLKAENAPVMAKNIRQGAIKTFFTSTYAGAVTFSVESAKDVKNRYGKISQASAALGEAERVTPEILCAAFMDGLFSSSTFTTADGVAACSTAHVLPDGSTTTSNALSAAPALDETAAEDMRVLARQVLGPSGNIKPLRITDWIVPSAYEPLAMKLSTSAKTIGSANNDPSIVKGTGVKVFDYLTSSTKWYGQTNSEPRDLGLFWHWIEKPQFITDQVVLMLQKVYVSYFRARYGILDFRAIFGSNAS